MWAVHGPGQGPAVHPVGAAGPGDSRRRPQVGRGGTADPTGMIWCMGALIVCQDHHFDIGFVYENPTSRRTNHPPLCSFLL